MRVLFMAAGALLIAAQASAHTTFGENRTYIHHLFRTYQDCRDAQHGGMGFNCDQTISFSKDGTALVMVTDIMSPATYTIEGDQVIVKRAGPGDIPESLFFKLDATERNLVSLQGRLEVWELKQPCE